MTGFRGDPERLADMVHAISRIAERIRGGREEFERDEMLQVWVVHHLEILGEAASGVSAELRREHPGIPWRGMSDLRNRLVHAYFDVDSGRVWTTVERDLPLLEAEIRAIMCEPDGGLR